MDYFDAMTAFVRAVELGSFSKAAVEGGLKVSTVSRYVSGLETDLGAALLNRSTRRLNLTEAGRLFYERATEILVDVEEARNAIRSLNARPQGLLRINAPSAFGRQHVMAHMKEFLAAYTDETVDLIQTATDVSVRIGALVDSTLVARKLASHRRILVASPAYLDYRPPPREPGQLRDHECLLFALQPTGAWYYRSSDDPEPLEIAVKGHLRANDSQTLRDAALSGVGVALLPTWLVGADIRQKRLVPVLPSYEWLIAPGPERAIWAVYPPKKVVSPKVKVFVAFLLQRFGQPPYWDCP
jgi:DNA-binding transcriptional LysR family regulator